MEQQIDFYSEDIEFSLPDKQKTREWIKEVVSLHQYDLESLTFVFCSDDYLHQMNVDYLDHDTLTDIITFDNADEDGIVEGDIFISVDRVKDNAEHLGVSFKDELHRVIIHGVLHLLGFDDKDSSSKEQMRNEEDSCLSLRKF
ncbi:MAG: rRNA maturation RNase YbeY [Hymenobacteraceae bacterium]|nr:rRNA maturation RNase YbeY [Hymenobacteraceae bacterium]MDX5397735.1 rRNA maturation RNase YbeY [Hymenobacteraceae bacterium]MDX5444280.1 rRNA maturation RNase YbeY [Hymenobacteraceae bacterium]MDX5513812.1 rRNA maturation RNase YbeY [Hymenobacteraceae bacterium]